MRYWFQMTVLLTAIAILPGCFVNEKLCCPRTPLLTDMSGITPGITRKDDVRRLLGKPFYSSDAWSAELYQGDVEYLRLVIIVILPIPGGTVFRPASLLVVYGSGDVVSGVAYQGEGCPKGCSTGDTKGLDIMSLQVLLAPQAETARLLGERSEPGRCTVLVDATDKYISRDIFTYGLYVDERFLQQVAGEGFFRIEVTPGTHLLSCMHLSTQGPPWKLSEPGHAILRDKPVILDLNPYDFDDELKFECSAGEAKYFKLKHTIGHGIFLPAGCGIELTDEAGFRAGVQGSREVIVPDAP